MTKLQFIAAPLHIGSHQISAGGIVTNPQYVGAMGGYSNSQLAIVVNGQHHPIGSPSVPFTPNWAFLYDPLTDILEWNHTFETAVGQYTLMELRSKFWQRGFDEFFENCRDIVYAQKITASAWRLTFVNGADKEDLDVIYRKPREHSFSVIVPRGFIASQHATSIREWCDENIHGEWNVIYQNPADLQIQLQVQNESEAVMAKLVWIDGNIEKELP